MTQKPLDYLEIVWSVLLLQFASHAGIVLSRVVAIAVCVAIFKPWIFIALGLHWLLTSVWLNVRKADYTSAWWEERLLNILAALVYVFVYIEVKESDHSRYHYAVVYGIFLVENTAMMTLWTLYASNRWTMMPTVYTTVFGGFFIGVLLMLAYYRFLYPKRAFSFDKMNRPRVIMDDNLITCTEKKHYPHSKHCPMLAQPTIPHSPPCQHKPFIAGKNKLPPTSLAFNGAALRCFPKLERADSTPDALPGAGTPESAPVDFYRAKDKGKVLSEVPKLPSPPLFTKLPPRRHQQPKTWTDVYAE